MAKRVRATKCEEVVKDSDGGMFDVEWICPFCKMETGELISISGENLALTEGNWETDQKCPICDEDLIVEIVDL